MVDFETVMDHAMGRKAHRASRERPREGSKEGEGPLT